MKILLAVLWMMVATSEFPDQYRWENRILLVFTTDQTTDQWKEFESYREAYQERQTLYFQISQKEVCDQEGTPVNADAGGLRDRYDVQSDFEILLIGKDGGVKLRSKQVVPSKKLFALIDSMPMRKREIRDH